MTGSGVELTEAAVNRGSAWYWPASAPGRGVQCAAQMQTDTTALSNKLVQRQAHAAEQKFQAVVLCCAASQAASCQPRWEATSRW